MIDNLAMTSVRYCPLCAFKGYGIGDGQLRKNGYMLHLDGECSECGTSNCSE